MATATATVMFTGIAMAMATATAMHRCHCLSSSHRCHHCVSHPRAPLPRHHHLIPSTPLRTPPFPTHRSHLCWLIVVYFMSVRSERDDFGIARAHQPLPPPAVFLISLYLLYSPLCPLCRCLLHPLLWLVVVCWVDGVGHRSRRRHRLSDQHRCQYCLPALPSRGAYNGDVRGRKRAWWRSPRGQDSAIAVLWKGRRSKREDVFMVLIVDDLSEN